MELERIQALATKLKRRLHISQQMAEYTASLLALKHSASNESFALCAEIQAIHSLKAGD
jgi:hypothetical protein